MIVAHQGNAGFFSRDRNENLEILNDPVQTVIMASIYDKYLVEGVMYSAHNAIGPLASAAHHYIGITMPAELNALLQASVDMALLGQVSLYKDSDFSAGTAITIVPHNLIDGVPPSVVLVTDPTIADNGTLVGTWALSSAAKTTKGAADIPYAGKFAFKHGVKYLVDFESLTADNHLEYNFAWGEPNKGTPEQSYIM